LAVVLPAEVLKSHHHRRRYLIKYHHELIAGFPVVAIMAAVNNATTAEAKEALGFRAFAADSEKNLVVNPWYCKDRTHPSFAQEFPAPMF